MNANPVFKFNADARSATSSMIHTSLVNGETESV